MWIAEKALARLMKIRAANVDEDDADRESDTAATSEAARRLMEDGWTEDEIVAYLKWSEEVRPNLSESTALRQMSKVWTAVEARLNSL